MPVYNGEQYLRDAMDSILNQTFKDFEFLIIDDGSVDHSVEIIKSYEDSRIKLEVNGKNLGLITTLNKGLDIAQGEYVARMDCDDISLPERLEKQVVFMDAHPEVGVCGTWFKSFTDSKSIVMSHPTSSEMIKVKLFFDSYLGHPTVIMRMSALNKHGLRYDPIHLHAEDYGLWVKCSFLFPLANIPEVLLHHRDHPASNTRIHLQQVMMGVMEINKRTLGRLGITDIDNATLASHYQIGHSHSYIFNNQDSLIQANEWLLKLQAANQVKQLYSEPHFSLLLAETWCEICSWAIRATSWGETVYLQSPLSSVPMNSNNIMLPVQKPGCELVHGRPEFVIDIIIPAYNREGFIRDTLLSAVKQTYPARQIIVVDDGSTDKTGLVVQELAQAYDLSIPIKYIRQDNSGPSAARNTGIRACTGNYIAFLDTDDLWEPDKLEKQIEVFKHSEYKELGVVYCDYNIIDATGFTINSHCVTLDPTVRGHVFDRLLSGNLIASSCSGALVKKECFDKVGVFDEGLPSSEDWDMWMRIAEEYDFDFVNQKLVKIRRHNTNLQNNAFIMLIGKILLLNKVAVKRDIPHLALQLVRYELTKCTVDAYNNGGLIDFSRYMNKPLKDQIYYNLHV